MICSTKGCENEARMALRTTRPTRGELKTVVWYDDRDDNVPKAASRLCKEHGAQTMKEMVDLLVGEDSKAK